MPWRNSFPSCDPSLQVEDRLRLPRNALKPHKLLFRECWEECSTKQDDPAAAQHSVEAPPARRDKLKREGPPHKGDRPPRIKRSDGRLPCFAFEQAGACEFGDQCNFSHALAERDGRCDALQCKQQKHEAAQPLQQQPKPKPKPIREETKRKRKRKEPKRKQKRKEKRQKRKERGQKSRRQKTQRTQQTRDEQRNEQRKQLEKGVCAECHRTRYRHRNRCSRAPKCPSGPGVCPACKHKRRRHAPHCPNRRRKRESSRESDNGNGGGDGGGSSSHAAAVGDTTTDSAGVCRSKGHQHRDGWMDKCRTVMSDLQRRFWRRLAQQRKSSTTARRRLDLNSALDMANATRADLINAIEERLAQVRVRQNYRFKAGISAEFCFQLGRTVGVPGSNGFDGDGMCISQVNVCE